MLEKRIQASAPLLRRHGIRSLCSKSLLSSFFITAVFYMCSGCEWSNQRGLNDSSSHEKPAISIVISNLGMTFPAGMDENNNPYLNYIEKMNDLDIKVSTPPPEVYEEKLDVIMSSGNLPDLLHTYNSVWFNHYAMQGSLLSLDDLINQYGPNLKEKIPDSVWDRVRYNGKIYAVPSLNEVIGNEIMYARKDWLDRLGLKPPVALDDYYEVMKAFTRNDPDGNGKQDTVGLTLMTDMSRSSPFFGAFGTQLNAWFERNGKLVNGSIMPETKKALAYLARLYHEGLLDREFPLNLHNNLYEKVENGKVGLFSATWYDTRGPIAANMKKDPNARWIALDYPTGIHGEKGVNSQDNIRGYNVIPVGTKHPELVIKMLDFIAGDYKNLKLGFENEIWTMENGQMVTDFAMHDQHLYRGIYQSLVDVPDPVLFKERLDSLGDFHLYDNLQTIEQNLIENEFYGIPTPAMSHYDKQLKDLQDGLINIIMGIEPIDAFDRFVEQWKQQGGDEITKEVNEWYGKQKKSGRGRDTQ
ncbi:extracellular solute-binding protein [Paenibacillus nasutitermitis]|uniref:Lipoprotein LipO n=1 Tax=Paenibacillus nasutitermitis TaxID=1652958 RepID=A0A916YTE8_9BACL|nr:extracellular solute-binding protein [Paenibacillus nasutitermitis]GGD59462.1 lipoprotein LipO [Paenibacillus nasutitermitis]